MAMTEADQESMKAAYADVRNQVTALEKENRAIREENAALRTRVGLLEDERASRDVMALAGTPAELAFDAIVKLVEQWQAAEQRRQTDASFAALKESARGG